MTLYNRKEVFTSSLAYFRGDELAANVWINKYALKDSNGNLYELNPDDMHQRLANELARIELNYKNPMNSEEIYNLLKDFKYIIPQGGPMSGIGNNLQTISLSNCFVVGNDADSYGGITYTDQEQIQLMKRRGGVGHDLSHIRPKGSPVNNSALTSTGVVSFMERFSNSTREVAQDGRRGALMLSLSVKHPDILNFIDAKLEQGKITGANISVKIDDDFMHAVKESNEYTQQFPINSKTPQFIQKVDASKIFNKIVHNAWKTAEPGILFWDTIINESVPDCYADLGYKTTSTNPCVVGDTLVKTDKGEFSIIDIVDRYKSGEEFKILSLNEVTNGLEYKKLENAQLTKRNAEILEIETIDGKIIRLTPNHKVLTEESGWIEAAKLTTEHTLLEVDD
jgi:ribonucleoside-diphosphate reductase alpha chain